VQIHPCPFSVLINDASIEVVISLSLLRLCFPCLQVVLPPFLPLLRGSACSPLSRLLIYVVGWPFTIILVYVPPKSISSYIRNVGCDSGCFICSTGNETKTQVYSLGLRASNDECLIQLRLDELLCEYVRASP